MKAADERPGVAGVVLAAGRSTRFAADAPKQLFRLAGEPLVRRAVRVALAAGLRPVVAVVGHAADEVVAALADLEVEVVRNDAYAEGQSTSVRAGLARVAATAAAAVFLPVDQPFLTARLLRRLVDAWAAGAGRIARPRAGERRGAPVLFDRAFFAELAALRGDAGGRQILARHADEVVEVEVDDPRELADVDTLDDWRRLAGGPASRLDID